ncbi:hypothetical protein P7C73_g4319, partial [Tremellales sp. Uapishka_1]
MPDTTKFNGKSPPAFLVLPNANRAHRRKPQAKKVMSGLPLLFTSTDPRLLGFLFQHKTWDGDAWLKVEGGKLTLLEETDGRPIATSTLIGDAPEAGSEFKIGGKDIEVDRAVTFDEFYNATKILNNKNNIEVAVKTSTNPYLSSIGSGVRPFKAPAQFKPPRPAGGRLPIVKQEHVPEASSSVGKVVTPSNFYAPVKGKKITIGEKDSRLREKYRGALHDPDAEDAVRMTRIPEEQAEKKGTEVVDVVLDPLLAVKMRAHQKEGVKSEGAILADEMGLGKTLQTIALIWTMLKQSPFAKDNHMLGSDRVGVMVGDGDVTEIKKFVNSRVHQVLIIGYEKLRKVIKELAHCQPPIELIVCDEGHRLKSKDNKTTKMFEALRTRRRIILSGTPVQNDLTEFWSMVDFACPGLLGTRAAFSKYYEKPILKAREPGCPAKLVKEGQDVAAELGNLSKEFIIRRTADVLDHYLPPKHEYVLFVAPTKMQLDVFDRLLKPANVDGLFRGGSGFGAQSLALIDLLRKTCNSPMLLRKKNDEGSTSAGITDLVEDAVQVIPVTTKNNDPSTSGKMLVLDKMLAQIHRNTTDKVVLVSNWTSTLDLFVELCVLRKYPYLRLDGNTPQKQRQEMVDLFNRGQRHDSFIFLLSAKAGGTGLNLIGASRLILFDSDWNPSTDLQAMARIHRDGQKKNVYIYRLLTTGTIDEKIYQRQITKTGLSDQMLDNSTSRGETKDSFTAKELKEIFSLDRYTDGYDLLLCDCEEGKTIEAIETPETPGTPETLDFEDKFEGIETDDDSDEETPTFVAASQYTSEPSKKRMQKAAVEKQAKLAALKKWKHLDAFSVKSIHAFSDEILYDILWDADAKASSSFVGVDPQKKRPRTDDPSGWFQDDDDEEVAGEMEGIKEVDSDDELIEMGRKRKYKGKSKSIRYEKEEEKPEGKKHDLRDLAARNQGGRIMFAFEKNSKSRL